MESTARPAILDVGVGHECQKHRRPTTSWMRKTPNPMLGYVSLMPRVHTARLMDGWADWDALHFCLCEILRGGERGSET